MEFLNNFINYEDDNAFLIGNGPNLYSGLFPSWKELLIDLYEKDFSLDFEGLPYTEVYDLIDIKVNRGFEVFSGKAELKKRVVKRLKDFDSNKLETHRHLISFCESHKIPVLTTNYDRSFEVSMGLKKHKIGIENFSRYYPWSVYYANHKLNVPTDGFGIWKMHGDIEYEDSLRLGLRDYMGAAEKARRLIHRGDEALFRGKAQQRWKGMNTWLHIWFNSSITIFGLGLGRDEVFIRWLMLERFRYKEMYGREMDMRFLTLNKAIDVGIKNFLRNLSVEIIEFDNYSKLYEE